MKKRILFASTILLLPFWLNGQSLDDALRYSQVFYQGTARFTGMGGAFTALGGDLSAITLNPAAVGVFRSPEFSVTPIINFRDITTDYENSVVTEKSSLSGLGQLGFVSTFTSGRGTGRSFNIAYTYNRTNNLSRQAVIDGISPNSSIADYFASRADGYRTYDLYYNDYLAYMGYETYLTDTVSNSYTDYSSVFSYYDDDSYVYGQRTTRRIDNSGYTGEHTIAIGTNINDKLYVGASLGISTLKYTSHYVHNEVDENDANPYFSALSFTEHFSARGTGLNLKLGVIVKPVEILRIGLSLQTPTVYNVDEVYYSTLSASYDIDMNGIDDNDYYSIDQGLTDNWYKIKTPFRINTGVALQVGKIALLSADYEFVDYSSARLSDGVDNYSYDGENSDVRTYLKRAGNLRLGGEVRLAALYLRAGYRYYGSAFEEGTLNENLSYHGISAGLGYRQKNFYADFSFSGLVSSETYLMYQDAWLADTYIDVNDKLISATIGLKF